MGGGPAGVWQPGLPKRVGKDGQKDGFQLSN